MQNGHPSQSFLLFGNFTDGQYVSVWHYIFLGLVISSVRRQQVSKIRSATMQRGTYYPPIMGNQMEKKMDNEMETGILG